MKKLISITTSIILTMAAFTSCGAESGTVSTDGSTSMEKVVGALGEAFMEDNKNITFTYNPTGSGSGITAVVAQAVETSGVQYLERLETDSCRITLVSSDGDVLYDSKTSADKMENHAKREEIKEALKKGFGESSRYSATLTEETFYYAKKLANGNVVRVSVDHATMLTLVLGMLTPIIIVLIGALALSIFLAYRISKRIVEPLNSIDLDKPLENEAYDELAPLLTHIERQKEQIHNQYKELEVRKSEFYAIIENMNEGLVLLSRDYTVLSINPAAGAFFSASPECIGKDFLTLERNHEINKALDNAVQDGRSEIEVSRNGHEYQLNISRIGSDEQTSGVVILVFDISDKVFAERNRKEFTANVSHELKTPLQSIMGSAELLENGLVKADDVPKFIGRIRSEAARLVTLIEDIIRLSQLDESTDFPLEDADIYEIAKDEAEMLSLTAQKRNVTISVKGKSTVIHAPKQLLHEIIYNLCDNAIKYNKEGGSVEVSVEESDNNVMLSVSDTGIGIPLDNQNRVFERFYRVDKSHSKETGGTGLGLSIVKHAVQYLNGKISLESTVGKGTKISVAFRV